MGTALGNHRVLNASLKFVSVFQVFLNGFSQCDYWHEKCLTGHPADWIGSTLGGHPKLSSEVHGRANALQQASAVVCALCNLRERHNELKDIQVSNDSICLMLMR